jgi:RNA polymerase subunit RPABC4/transcription elongation factor Spt4
MNTCAFHNSYFNEEYPMNELVATKANHRRKNNCQYNEIGIASLLNSSYDKDMDDNSFECGNCGYVIYPEMTRCPQCGQSVYPVDDNTTNIEEETNASRLGKTIGIVLIGWLVASGIATVIHFVVAEFVAPPFIPGIAKFFLYLAGPLGSLVGGYVCAGLARQNAKLLGGLVGVLSLPVSVLLATHWIRVNLAIMLNPILIGIGLLIIIAGVCGGWIYEKFSNREEWQEKWRVRGFEDMLYRDLLGKVRFNGSAADRLIEHERKIDPQASRLKLIQNAIDRWESDNR